MRINFLKEIYLKYFAKIKFSKFRKKQILPVAVSCRMKLRKVFQKLVPETAENTVISTNFQGWKFCGKTQFLHSFRQAPFGLLLSTFLGGTSKIFCILHALNS